MTYTAATFAPVQSFISSSRKLRDLYGSSLLLSHLARAIAADASQRGFTVISPASISSSRGVPNVLVIHGDYRHGHAREALQTSWQRLLQACRLWLEQELPQLQFQWDQSWKACGLHTWELFHGQGTTISQARQALAVNKQQRDWSVPNWTGESSTLSSAEAVVWPEMGAVRDPRRIPIGLISEEARAFLHRLRSHPALGEAFAALNEEISLTELVKRLVTYPAVALTAFATDHDPVPALAELIPERFQATSAGGPQAEQPDTVVWFQADGDGIGDYLQTMRQTLSAGTTAPGAPDPAEAEALSRFSAAMRAWAASLYKEVPRRFPGKATVVYAGGDDLFGALHESAPGRRDLAPEDLWAWLNGFPALWSNHQFSDLTVSMGVVWADAQVPQREALQHARDAEATAKARGKNRFALRLVYAGGNHLEWSCPWAWLQPILSHYTDREGRSLRFSSAGRPPSWRHLAEDLQWLKGRQALTSARALWQVYFPALELPPSRAGSVAFRATAEQPEHERRFEQWLFDLGGVMAGLEKHRPAHTPGAQP